MTDGTLVSYAASVRRLADRWLGAVAAQQAPDGGDFACSPAGLWLALSAMAAGARGGTAAEFRSVLGVSGPEAAQAVTEVVRVLAATDALGLAIGVWSRVPVLDSYRAALPDVGVGALGDAAAIDAWVRGATGGLIEALPVALTPNVVLLLVTALALKARWERPFESSKTRDRPFTDAAGAVHQVPTMARSLPVRDTWAVGGAQVAELRCVVGHGGSSVRVRFVLGAPGAGAAEVLPAAWAPDADRKALEADRIQLTLPRLQLRTRLDATADLPGLGIRQATGPADFGGLSPDRLRIDKVVQETVVKVAEAGIEAASVTAVFSVRSMVTGGPRRVLNLDFDRPFGVVVFDGEGEVPLFTAWQASAPRDVA